MTMRAARRLVDASGPWHRFAPPGTVLAQVVSRSARISESPKGAPIPSRSHQDRIEALCALAPALRANGARDALYGLLRARRLAELEGFLRRGGV